MNDAILPLTDFHYAILEDMIRKTYSFVAKKHLHPLIFTLMFNGGLKTLLQTL